MPASEMSLLCFFVFLRLLSYLLTVLYFGDVRVHFVILSNVWIYMF